MDTDADSGAVFLCISERHQGKVQLAVDSVHLIVLSTATICIHSKQTDGTSPKTVCSLPTRSIAIGAAEICDASMADCVACLSIYQLDAGILMQVMVCIVPWTTRTTRDKICSKA